MALSGAGNAANRSALQDLADEILLQQPLAVHAGKVRGPDGDDAAILERRQGAKKLCELVGGCCHASKARLRRGLQL